MWNLQDEYQRALIYRAGFQSFIILQVILLMEYFTIWLFDFVWQNQMDVLLFPMLVSVTYFLFRMLWKNAYLSPNYQDHMLSYFFLSCNCMFVGGLILSSNLPVSVNMLIVEQRTHDALILLGAVCVFGFGFFLGCILLWNYVQRKKALG